MAKSNVNKIQFEKRQQLLVPLTEEDEKSFLYIPEGSIYIGVFHKIRNPGNHRRAFEFLNQVFGFQNKFYMWEFERFRRRMLIYSGACDEEIIDGKAVISPWSMAFGNMDEYLFKRVFSDMIQAAYTYFVWGTPEQQKNQCDIIMSFDG